MHDSPSLVLSVRNLDGRIPDPARHADARSTTSPSTSPRGEVLGVVGESGAGKSLTGAAVIGLLEPPGRIAGGEIRLDGQRIDNLPPEEMRKIRGRRIGMVFQDPLTSLNPLYRIGDQIVETIRTHLPRVARPRRASAPSTCCSEVGIPGARAAHRQLSARVLRRHAPARGARARAVRRARPVIADEPTTALDVSVQAQIIALLKRLCRERGTAVMLITHDMGVIAETADRVAVMYAGRIAEIGPVRDVVQRAAATPTRKGLMGAIPTLGGAAGRLAQIPGSMPRLAAIPPGCAFNPRCAHAFDALPHRAARAACRPGHREAACWLRRRDAAGRRPAHDGGDRRAAASRSTGPHARLRRLQALARPRDRGRAQAPSARP